MTQRRRLDAFLVEQAVAAGAELREGARVGAIDPSETGVAARIRGEAVRAGVLVGADGANGIVARTLGSTARSSAALRSRATSRSRRCGQTSSERR